MTQADQTLAKLRERGEDGLHTFEMRAMFIGNPSQRIAELEARGHVIGVSPKERLRGKAWGVRYTLLSDAERAGSTVVASSPALASASIGVDATGPLNAPGLFEADEFAARPRGAYEDAA